MPAPRVTHLCSSLQAVAAWRVFGSLDEVPDAATYTAHGERAADIVQDTIGARLALVLHHRLLPRGRWRSHFVWCAALILLYYMWTVTVPNL